MPRLLHLALAAVTLLMAGAASAATVVRHDLNSLVQRAGVIATGEVMSKETRWLEGRIVTTFTITPKTMLKGAPSAALKVEVLGGTVDGLGQKVYGVSQFKVGEQVVVFLEPIKGRTTLRVVGMSQGKLRIEPSADGAKVLRELNDVALVAPNATGTLEAATPALPEVQPLSRFLSEIKVVVGQQSTRR